MTIKQAKSTFGISTRTLFEWVDDNTLELVDEAGKPSVRICEAIPDSVVKTVGGVPTMTVGTMRELVRLWMQDRKEAALCVRVFKALPAAVIIGLASTIALSAATGHSIGSGLAGAIIGTFFFLCLIGRATWIVFSKRAEQSGGATRRKAAPCVLSNAETVPSINTLQNKV